MLNIQIFAILLLFLTTKMSLAGELPQSVVNSRISSQHFTSAPALICWSGNNNLGNLKIGVSSPGHYFAQFDSQTRYEQSSFLISQTKIDESNPSRFHYEGQHKPYIASPYKIYHRIDVQKLSADKSDCKIKSPSGSYNECEYRGTELESSPSGELSYPIECKEGQTIVAPALICWSGQQPPIKGILINLGVSEYGTYSGSSIRDKGVGFERGIYEDFDITKTIIHREKPFLVDYLGHGLGSESHKIFYEIKVEELSLPHQNCHGPGPSGSYSECEFQGSMKIVGETETNYNLECKQENKFGTSLP